MMMLTRMFDGRQFCRVLQFGVIALVACCCCLCSCFPILRTKEKISECGVTHFVMGAVNEDVVYVQRVRDRQARAEGEKDRFFVKMDLLPYDCCPHWWGIASFCSSLPATYSRDFSIPVESAYVKVEKALADRLTGCVKEEKDAFYAFRECRLASGFDPKAGRIYGRVSEKRMCGSEPPVLFVQDVERRFETHKILKKGKPVWPVRASAVVAHTVVDVPVFAVSMVTSPVWGGIYYLLNPDCLQ